MKRNKNTFICNHLINSDMANEIHIFSQIKNIKNYSFYFYIFQDFEIDEENVKLIYLNHPSNYSLLFHQKTYFSFIRSFLSILDSLEILQKHSIAYLNPYIHSFLLKNNSDIVLSKFYYSLNMKKIKIHFLKKLNIFKNMNKIYPLEIHFIHYLLFSSSPTLNLENILSILKKYSLNEQKEVVDFYSSFIHLPKETIIHSLLGYWKSWDLYILSKQFFFLTENPKYESFYPLFLSLQNPIPTKRISFSSFKSFFISSLLKDKSNLFS